MPDSAVVVAMQAHKAALLRRELSQTQAMVRQWNNVEAALRDQVELFARRVVEDGLTASQVRSRQFQLERAQSLLNQTYAELERYSAYADTVITNQQRTLASDGIAHATEAIEGVATGIRFDRLPIEAVENMVGLAGDNSPLRTLLRDSYGAGANGMMDKLATGVTLGQNPKVIARNMVRDGLSQSLNRMLTISRTESLRVYKEASRQTYINSKVVISYLRLSSHDNRVCVGCLAMDGKEYPLNEPFASHPNCRCTLIPNVAGYKTPQWLQGADWLASQPEKVQNEILGQGRFESYQDGVPFERFATRKTDAVWGAAIVPTAVRDLK